MAGGFLPLCAEKQRRYSWEPKTSYLWRYSPGEPYLAAPEETLTMAPPLPRDSGHPPYRLART